MNIAEHRLNIVHQLEELSEESLLEVEKLITQVSSEQKSKQHIKSVWLGIKKWREQAQFSNNDEELTDKMVASWRDKSAGRDFSWNS